VLGVTTTMSDSGDLPKSLELLSWQRSVTFKYT
jgi:hypothetical protein